jgi:hypothetical protein
VLPGHPARQRATHGAATAGAERRAFAIMPEPVPPAEPNPPADGEPRQVAKMARQHLTRVGRAGTNRFRLIIDDPERKNLPAYPAMDLVGTFDQHAQALRRANDAGYGIFYMANRAEGGRKASDVVEANCFFADFDGTPRENVDRLGLKPHVEVETSPQKFHFYWRITGIPIEAWTAVQKRLIALFDSDRSIHDLPRIMRLPGFLHQKTPETPHLVAIVGANDAPPYTYDAFIAALTAAEQAAGIGAAKPRKQLPASIAAPDDRKRAGDIGRAESALRHLIGMGLLDLGDRGEWIRVGIALKTTYGEDGFGLWLKLSSEADGFEGEDDLRGQWNTFKNDLPPEKQLTIASFVAIAKANGWSGGTGGGSRGRAEGGGGEGEPGDDGWRGVGPGKKADAATVMVTLADDAGDEVFISPDGLAYVTYDRKRADGTVHRVTARLDGSGYKGLLLLRYHEEAVNKTPARDQITAAVALMEARARAANVRHPVYLRSAHHDGRVYVCIDPDEGRFAEIDDSAEGWRMIDDCPVRFVAGSRGALPMPERGGTLDTFDDHFNVSGDDRIRTVGFMLGTLQLADAYAVLIAEGEAGAAKSNYGDKVVALTDPPRGKPKAARFSIATEERNLHVQANRCSVMFLDNVSSFTNEVADQICRLSTGAASSFRTHNTMDEEQQFALARPVVVTCISTPSSRTDLLSRALRVTVQVAERRRTEEAVWRDFRADAGKMLGFLFECVSVALRNRAAVAARAETGDLALPRMADFAQWVEAAGDKLGLRPGGFAELLCGEQEAMQAEAAQRDPIVEGLVRLYADPDTGEVLLSARSLRDRLAATGLSGELPHPNQFRQRIARQTAGLRALGIAVRDRYDSHAKCWKFEISWVGEDRVRNGRAVANDPGDPAERGDQVGGGGDDDSGFPF